MMMPSSSSRDALRIPTNVPRVPSTGADEVWQGLEARVKSAVLFPNRRRASRLTAPGGLPRMGASRAGVDSSRRGNFMRSGLRVAGGVALTLLIATPAFAEKCKFIKPDDPLAHERDESDPPLRCRRCEEIAAEIAKNDANVWTLDLKHGRPRRIEIKKETGTSEVYWYIYYEVTNNDKLDRPCFIDVSAESDKGKNTYKYHDSMVPECKEELKKILGIKKDETLYTSEELRSPGEKNELPNKDNAGTGRGPPASDLNPPPGSAILPKVNRNKESGIYEGANAKLGFLMIKPGETKKCVALFGKLDTEFDWLTIYFYGLCNTTTSVMKTDKADALNPEASPVAVAEAGELRLVNDSKMQEPEANKRKVVERIFCIEYSCLGDEFAKTARSIIKNEEQHVRPKN